MANIDGARGLIPVNSPFGTIKCTLYPIESAYATSLFRGDPVARTSSGVLNIASTGAVILGAAIGFYDSTFAPINYYLGSTATQAYALVADDVNQEYVIQEDGVGSQLASTDAGANVDFVSGTGSSVTGESRYEADSSSVNTTATLGLRLIKKQPVVNNAYGAWCKWIVKINYHQAAIGTVGAGI